MGKTGLTLGCARDTYVRRGKSRVEGLAFHKSDEVRASPTLVAANRNVVNDDIVVVLNLERKRHTVVDKRSSTTFFDALDIPKPRRSSGVSRFVY